MTIQGEYIMINFTGGNVPITIVAKVMKKDKQFVRIGIQEKWLWKCL